MTLTNRPAALGTTGGLEYRLRMTAHLRSARLPRKLAEIALDTWDLGHLTDRASVILSELVTNAAKLMPGTEIEIGVSSRDGWLRLEVSDASPRMPGVPASVSLTGEGGRGLFVAEALADKFGIEPRAPAYGGGKTIWALLVCDAPESAEGAGCEAAEGTG
jgi:anti-sigma regulatory factor (Ser/Thr protein kinase)